MKPNDVAVWERFVDKRPDFFESVDYDYHIGEGADFLPTNEDTPDGRENRLYQRKVDVVGYRKNEVWIIEVKPEAGMTALGQVLTYAHLAEADPKLNTNQTLAVVCEKVTPEMENLFDKHNIIIMLA